METKWKHQYWGFIIGGVILVLGLIVSIVAYTSSIQEEKKSGIKINKKIALPLNVDASSMPLAWQHHSLHASGELETELEKHTKKRGYVRFTNRFVSEGGSNVLVIVAHPLNPSFEIYCIPLKVGDAAKKGHVFAWIVRSDENIHIVNICVDKFKQAYSKKFENHSQARNLRNFGPVAVIKHEIAHVFYPDHLKHGQLMNVYPTGPHLNKHEVDIFLRHVMPNLIFTK